MKALIPSEAAVSLSMLAGLAGAPRVAVVFGLGRPIFSHWSVLRRFLPA